MRFAPLFVTFAFLATQCSPSLHCAPRAQPEAGAGTSQALPVAFLSPDDFDGRTLGFDLPPAPSGKTVLVVTPGTRLHDLTRAGKGWRDERVPIEDQVGFDVSVGAIDRASEQCPARALPAPTRLEAHAWRAPRSPPTPAPPGDTKEFRLNGPDRPYVANTGRKVLESDPYVFYDEVGDPMPYTAAQFAAIDAKVRAGYPEIVRRFGAPTDLDGNGRILVYLGHAVAAEDPSRLAYVDPCNLGAAGDCGMRGEVIYVRSLPDMGSPGSQDDYALVRVPDTILHETIHLAWLAHGWRRFGHFAFRHSPRYFREGSAQLFAFSDEFEQEVSWKLVDEALWSRSGAPIDEAFRSRSGAKTGPFSSPYVLGGLFFHWLRQRHGEGVDQALLDGFVDYRDDDPVAQATGMPEPLAVAALAASLYFDGTPFGHDTGLELPADDVRKRLPRGMPVIALGPGSSRHDISAYTGHVIYEVSHASAIHVELVTRSTDKAYVLVAQP